MSRRPDRRYVELQIPPPGGRRQTLGLSLSLAYGLVWALLAFIATRK